MRGKHILNEVVNVRGKVVGEKQERLSQLYECHVARKAGVTRG